MRLTDYATCSCEAPKWMFYTDWKYDLQKLSYTAVQNVLDTENMKYDLQKLTFKINSEGLVKKRGVPYPCQNKLMANIDQMFGKGKMA